jgi:hypothetical protein
MDKHRKYDLVVPRAARQFVQGILSEDPDEASDCLAQSREGLLRALGLRGAIAEVDGQSYVRRALLGEVGDEILNAARRQLFEVVFPRCDPELRGDIADAFDRMQQQFHTGLTLPVIH